MRGITHSLTVVVLRLVGGAEIEVGPFDGHVDASAYIDRFGGRVAMRAFATAEARESYIRLHVAGPVG